MKTCLLAIAALLTVSAILLSLAVPVNHSSLTTTQSDASAGGRWRSGTQFPAATNTELECWNGWRAVAASCSPPAPE
jgi:hypothetical protein